MHSINYIENIVILLFSEILLDKDLEKLIEYRPQCQPLYLLYILDDIITNKKYEQFGTAIDLLLAVHKHTNYWDTTRDLLYTKLLIGLQVKVSLMKI